MRIILIAFLIITSSCSANKLSKNHGFTSLESKFEKIKITKNK